MALRSVPEDEAAETSSDFDTSFPGTSVDCYQNNVTGSDDRTFVSKTDRTTDKVVIRNQPCYRTFNKRRVSKAIRNIFSKEFQLISLRKPMIVYKSKREE